MKLIIYIFLILVLPISYILPQDESEENEKPMMINGVLACGVERWAVKTCIDADTANINFNNIVPSSIAYQRSLVHPTLPGDNVTRLAVEDTVYQITCQLVEYKYETDQDFHVVIKTIGSTSETMVAEIADPTCAGISNTSRYQQMVTLRNWFTSRYSPTSSFKFVGDTVTLTGVGFFDFAHGQTGAAPNQREIHPILSMVLANQQVTLSLKALIEGLYNGNTMVPDTITVELHSANSPYSLIESKQGILNSLGAGLFNFNTAVNGTPYYIVVKGKNTIETWSATTQSFISSALSYDFTSSATQAYTDGSITPMAANNGKWCIYIGDLNQDGVITSSDYIDVDNDNNNFDYHFNNDLNGDGAITSNDYTFIDNNNLLVHTQKP